MRHRKTEAEIIANRDRLFAHIEKVVEEMRNWSEKKREYTGINSILKLIDKKRRERENEQGSR